MYFKIGRLTTSACVLLTFFPVPDARIIFPWQILWRRLISQKRPRTPMPSPHTHTLTMIIIVPEIRQWNEFKFILRYTAVFRTYLTADVIAVPERGLSRVVLDKCTRLHAQERASIIPGGPPSGLTAVKPSKRARRSLKLPDAWREFGPLMF